MKVKVMKEFVDVHTQEVHKVNDIMDVTQERLAEIQKVDTGLVKEMVETPKRTGKAKE